MVENLCLLRSGRQVRAKDLPAWHRERAASAPSPSGSTTLRLSLDQPLEELSRQIIEACLSLESGSRKKAAERLGISLRTLQRYLASGKIGLPQP